MASLTFVHQERVGTTCLAMNSQPRALSKLGRAGVPAAHPMGEWWRKVGAWGEHQVLGVSLAPHICGVEPAQPEVNYGHGTDKTYCGQKNDKVEHEGCCLLIKLAQWSFSVPEATQPCQTCIYVTKLPPPTRKSDFSDRTSWKISLSSGCSWATAEHRSQGRCQHHQPRRPTCSPLPVLVQ